MTKQYIALQAVQVSDANGNRVSIEPRVEGKVSGLFEHKFDAKTEKRLLDLGAIRLPEGTEEHEDPTKVAVMDDRRMIDGQVDPLDHDGDGKKGGTKPATETAAQKKARLKAEADAKADSDGGEGGKGDDLLDA